MTATHAFLQETILSLGVLRKILKLLQNLLACSISIPLYFHGILRESSSLIKAHNWNRSSYNDLWRISSKDITPSQSNKSYSLADTEENR